MATPDLEQMLREAQQQAHRAYLDALPSSERFSHFHKRIESKRRTIMYLLMEEMDEIREFIDRAKARGLDWEARQLTGLLDRPTEAVDVAIYGAAPEWPGPGRTEEQQAAWRAAMMDHHRQVLLRAQARFAAEVCGLVYQVSQHAGEGQSDLVAAYRELALSAYTGVERTWDGAAFDGHPDGSRLTAEMASRTSREWRAAFAADRAAVVAEHARMDSGEELETDGDWRYDPGYQLADYITDALGRGQIDHARAMLDLLTEEEALDGQALGYHEPEGVDEPAMPELAGVTA